MIKVLIPLVWFAAVLCNTEPIDTEEWPIFEYFLFKQTVDPRVLPGFQTWSAQSWYELFNERDRVISEAYPECPPGNENDLKAVFVTTPEEVIDAFFHSVLAPDDYEAAWSTKPFQTYVLQDDNVFNCGLLYILALVDGNGLPVDILVLDDNEYRADEVRLTCVNIESALSPFGQTPPVLELEFNGKIPQEDFTEELSEIEVTEEIVILGGSDAGDVSDGFIQFGEGGGSDEIFVGNEFDHQDLSDDNFEPATAVTEDESVEETTEIYYDGDNLNTGLFEPFPENQLVQGVPEDVLDQILFANDFDQQLLTHDNLSPGTVTEESTEEITAIDYGATNPDIGNFSPTQGNVLIDYVPDYSEQFQAEQDFGEHLRLGQDPPSTVTEEITEESTEIDFDQELPHGNLGPGSVTEESTEEITAIDYSAINPGNGNFSPTQGNGFIEYVPEDNSSDQFQSVVEDFGEHQPLGQDPPSTVTEEITEESTEIDYSANNPENNFFQNVPDDGFVLNVPDNGFVQNIPEYNFGIESQGYDEVGEVQTIETTQVETTEDHTSTGMFKRNKLRFAQKK